MWVAKECGLLHLENLWWRKVQTRTCFHFCLYSHKPYPLIHCVYFRSIYISFTVSLCPFVLLLSYFLSFSHYSNMTMVIYTIIWYKYVYQNIFSFFIFCKQIYDEHLPITKQVFTLLFKYSLLHSLLFEVL